MRTVLGSIALVGLLGVLSTVHSEAASLPAYQNAGTINSASYTFNVQNTGTVTAYFAGSNAGLTDLLSIYNNGQIIQSDVFNNHSSALGDYVTFNVTASDVLSFSLSTSEPKVFSSDPALNVDGVQHIYSTNFNYAGGNSIGFNLAAGTYTYVGFEDRSPSNGNPYQSSDEDYNDTQFLFSNTRVSSVPLPASLPMFGGAILALAAFSLGMNRWVAPKSKAVSAG